MTNRRTPKILVIDIETKPAKAYVWGLRDVNISIDQLIAPSAPICFAAKYVGENKMHFHSDWMDGHAEMIKAAHKLISEADAVVTYNGDRFDLPKLQGEFLLEHLPPPPPWTSIDLLKIVKKLGFQSAKLGYIGPLLTVGNKVKNAGFSLWTAVEDGDPKAQRDMTRYCKGDVSLTEQVYLELRPYIHNHPHLADTPGDACAACGSGHLQKRGVRRTKYFITQRLQCQGCGAWQDGTRKHVPTPKGEEANAVHND